jgi:hypothetical protein
MKIDFLMKKFTFFGFNFLLFIISFKNNILKKQN